MGLEEKKVYLYLLLPLTIGTFALGLASIQTFWYRSAVTDNTGTLTIRYHWNYATASNCEDGECDTLTFSYSTLVAVGLDSDVADVFDTSHSLSYVANIAAAFNAITTFFLVVVLWSKAEFSFLTTFRLRGIKIFQVIVGVIAAGFYFLAWVVFLRLPSAFPQTNCQDGPCESFIGSNTSSGIERTWGPDAGWALALICTVTSAASVVVNLIYFRSVIMNKTANVAPTPS